MNNRDRQAKPDTFKSEQQIQNWGFDEVFKVPTAMELVHNPATDSADRKVEVDAEYVQFDPDDSQPIYIGINSSVSALDSDLTWLIYQFTYSGSNTTSIKRKVGAWESRENLFV